MNSMHISNYEYMAKQFATEQVINEEKREYFLRGVQWAFDAIESTLRNAPHPMADESTNARLTDWALKDLKKAMKSLKEESK